MSKSLKTVSALAIAAATFTATLTAAEARVAPQHMQQTRQSVHVVHAASLARHSVQSAHFVSPVRNPVQSARFANLARHSVATLPVGHQPSGSGKGGVKPDFDIGGAITAVNDAINKGLDVVEDTLERLNNDPGPTCGWLVCSDGSNP